MCVCKEGGGAPMEGVTPFPVQGLHKIFVQAICFKGGGDGCTRGGSGRSTGGIGGGRVSAVVGSPQKTSSTRSLLSV